MGVLKSCYEKGDKRGINRRGNLPFFFVCLGLDFGFIRQFDIMDLINCEKERNLIFKKYPVMKLT
ncbi:hypothetical protein ABE26_14360 [Cytobacillus firmus]|nr:hypothetical protein [Cytobacillus firmus]